jgi:hypothetical protein
LLGHTYSWMSWQQNANLTDPARRNCANIWANPSKGITALLSFFKFRVLYKILCLSLVSNQTLLKIVLVHTIHKHFCDFTTKIYKFRNIKLQIPEMLELLLDMQHRRKWKGPSWKKQQPQYGKQENSQANRQMMLEKLGLLQSLRQKQKWIFMETFPVRIIRESHRKLRQYL